MPGLFTDEQTEAEAARERQARRQRENQIHAHQHRSMWDDNGQVSREFLETITGTDLEADTKDLLQSMLSREFVLGKLTDAEQTEIKWLTRNLRLKIKAMHPPKNSAFQGEFRKFLFDDPDEGLTHLTARQKQEIDSIVMTIFTRATRAKEGWQQEEMSKSYSVSETRTQEQQSDRGLFK